MSEINRATQIISVEVVGKGDDLELKLTPQPCTGSLCDDEIITEEQRNTSGVDVTITQMKGESTLIFKLTESSRLRYEMLPISGVSNFGRNDVTPASNIVQPQWHVESAATFEQFVPQANLTKDSVTFTSVAMPPAGEEHACQFNLNVALRDSLKNVVVNVSLPESTPSSDDSDTRDGLFSTTTITHDPIIIVGKPK